jgi:tryptophanyl-tRNA synthetase
MNAFPQKPASVSKGTILSGIQPTGELHIGNYFGAIANWARLQGEYDCFYAVVDLHAMTMPYQPNRLRENTEQMVVDLLACGIDPDKAILFIQSLVPEHTELCWVLNCVCSFGDLTRQVQFKDKSEQLEDQTADQHISSGLFTYPVLQAADILIYRAQYVPVGRDQVQHLELSRDIARRFNHQFGEFFALPETLLTDTPKIQSLADPDRKMSKQFGPKHYIGLFEDENSLRAKVKAAVTDTGTLPDGVNMSAGVENLFSILRACGNYGEAESLLADYNAGNHKYAALKEAVGDALSALVNPMRSRRAELMKDRSRVIRNVHEMSTQARDVARNTMKEVRTLVGLPDIN